MAQLIWVLLQRQQWVWHHFCLFSSLLVSWCWGSSGGGIALWQLGMQVQVHFLAPDWANNPNLPFHLADQRRSYGATASALLWCLQSDGQYKDRGLQYAFLQKGQILGVVSSAILTVNRGVLSLYSWLLFSLLSVTTSLPSFLSLAKGSLKLVGKGAGLATKMWCDGLCLPMIFCHTIYFKHMVYLGYD